MKRRNAFKKVFCSALVGLLTLTTILPNVSIVANAQTDATSYVVLQGGSQTATFKHAHKTSGTKVTNARIQAGQTVSGYTRQSACYSSSVKHEHEGSITTGGNCFEAIPHTTHVYNGELKTWNGVTYATERGGCYTTPYYHTHIESICGTSSVHHHDTSKPGNCYYWEEWPDICVCGEGPLWHVAGVPGYDGHTYTPSGTWKTKCGYSEGQVITTYTCGFTEGQLMGYKLNCTKTIDGYVAKNPDPYYTDRVYINDCGITAGSTIGKATVSATMDNRIKCDITNNISSASYTITLNAPGGITKTLGNGEYYDCTTVGTHTITVNFKSTIRGEVVDNDTVTFTYNPVASDCGIIFHDYDGTELTRVECRQGEEPSVAPVIPTREGYTFMGFAFTESITDYSNCIYNQNGRQTVSYFLPLNGAGTPYVDLYAIYEANPYNVAYYRENPDEETPNTITTVFHYDESNPAIANQKSYTGYTLDGYYEGENKIFEPTGSYVKTKWDIPRDISVTPKFTAKTYALNYSLNKEEAVTSHTQTIAYNTEYGLTTEDLANRKTYKGYTFEGWFDDTYGKIFNANGTVAGGTDKWRYDHDINAKATYTANSYTVTYYVENPAEEGTVNHTDTFTFDQTTGLKLSTAVKSYTGWTLDGFYKGTEKVFNADGTYVGTSWDIDENITVEPKWVAKTYTLYYNLNKEDPVGTNSQIVTFNSPYGLTESDLANRKTYKGYTFEGWFDDTYGKIFNANGTIAGAIDSWRYDHDINAKATYTANPYKVYYNTSEAEATNHVLDVVFDGTYRLPASDVNSVPKIDGYTFDGWYLESDPTVRVFKPNGASVQALYQYDSDIVVKVKYHKNKYKIHFNNTDIDDDNLYQTIEVTFDEAYLDISQAPYKTGYVFDGHTLEGTDTFIWDGKGDKTHAIWDFVLGNDGTEINVKKHYTPKTFTVQLGSDFDNDGVIDSVEDTKTATYDSTYFDLTIPADIDGYTFDGWYLYGVVGEKMIATYDPSTKVLTKADTTWVYDDGVNWVNDAHSDLILVKKWHKNTYTVKYNNTDIADTNLNKIQIVVFDEAYPDIAVSPYKTGYVFNGHKIGSDFVWDKEGKATHTTWDFVLGTDNANADAFKDYSAKEYIVQVGRDFDNDGVLDSVEQEQTITYDGTYNTLTFTVPETINGYTFDGWYLVEQDKFIVSKTGSKESNTWVYDDGKDWNTETYDGVFHIALRWHKNTYTVKYNDTTIADTTKKSVVFTFDMPYGTVSKMPHKYGYTGTGYYFKDAKNVEQLLWKEDGTTVKDTFTFDLSTDNATIEVYKKYEPNPYVVTYNTEEGVTPDKTLNVVFDSSYRLPEADVNTVPYKEGYTFDGWFLEDGTQIFATDGTPISSATYDYEGNRTVFVRYHANAYTVQYNTENTDDTNLDRSQNVIFDSAYTSIPYATYKKGYLFDGHFIEGTDLMVWDKSGNVTHSVWDFVTANVDNDTIKTYKKYHPKTVTVNVGIDYNEDGKADTTALLPSGQTYNQTFTMLFDDIIPEFEFPALTEPGLTFMGWYVYCKDEEVGAIYRYDESTKLLVKENDNWIWDDGKDWNKESETEFTVLARFSHNPVKVTIYTETDTKIGDKNIGQKADYTFNTKNRTEYFDLAYANETVPTKRGYTFKGYIVNPKNENEKTDIWDKDAKSTEEMFRWLEKEDGTVKVVSVFEADTITGSLPTKKYDAKTDTETDSPVAISYVYDTAYGDLPFIPEKEGYDFKNITDKDGNVIWDINGKAVQEVWEYVSDDIANFVLNWTPKTYVLVLPSKKEYTVTYGEAVADVDTMSRTGYTFGGYNFDYFGKTVNGFNGSGKYNANTWVYDMGATGTKIPLSDVWNTNTYRITVKPMVKDLEPYTVEVNYDSTYVKLQIPEKKGYTFAGYYTEYNSAFPEELSTQIWDKDGNPLLATFTYSHDITVLAEYTPKVYYLHLGDKVITVTYDELVAKGVVLDKDGTEDDDYTYTYDFTGWYMKNGTQLFDGDGNPIYSVWALDLGEDGSHIYLDGQFEENKTEKEKEIEVEPEEDEEVIEETSSEEVSEETSEPTSEEPVKEKKGLTVEQKKIIKRVAITSGAIVGGTITVGGLSFFFIWLFFLFGKVGLIYRYKDSKGRKVISGLANVKKYKKSEYANDGYPFYLRLGKGYYNAVLDERSKNVSVKFSNRFLTTHHGKGVRIFCKDKYGDFVLRNMNSSKVKSGEQLGHLKNGYIEAHLDKSFNN